MDATWLTTLAYISWDLSVWASDRGVVCKKNWKNQDREEHHIIVLVHALFMYAQSDIYLYTHLSLLFEGVAIQLLHKSNSVFSGQ